MVARYLPGLGDPMLMTLPELGEWGDILADMLQREFGSSGGNDHRARVEADMRRLYG